jgi:DNA-binding XRE family transcriptional regulator
LKNSRRYDVSQAEKARLTKYFMCAILRSVAIRSAQIKAARALLGMTADQLADASGVHVSTIRRIETDVSRGSPLATRALKSALEAAGIEFLPLGVQLRQGSDDGA